MKVDAVNILNLNPVKDSTIINVNLYSRQAQITRAFKLSPGLTIPLPSATASNKTALSSVTAANGVVAQWSGSGSDVNVLGKDGRLEWMCSISAHAKINLLLQWDVSTTQKRPIEGL